MKRAITIVLLVVIGGIMVAEIGWSYYRIVYKSRLLNKQSKVAISRIHEALQIGGSKDAVIIAFNREKTNRLAMHTELKHIWSIGMPFEFGATDWVLYIQFDNNDTIGAVYVRTSDNIYSKPNGASSDKGLINKTMFQ